MCVFFTVLLDRVVAYNKHEKYRLHTVGIGGNSKYIVLKSFSFTSLASLICLGQTCF